MPIKVTNAICGNKKHITEQGKVPAPGGGCDSKESIKAVKKGTCTTVTTTIQWNSYNMLYYQIKQARDSSESHSMDFQQTCFQASRYDKT